VRQIDREIDRYPEKERKSEKYSLVICLILEREKGEREKERKREREKERKREREKERKREREKRETERKKEKERKKE
jgi:hypothetical protein